MAQSGKLILDGVAFTLDDSNETEFYIFGSDEQEGTITISFDASFQEEKFQNDVAAPYICVNSHETGKTSVEALAGSTYHVDSIRESNDREDLFYLFEHEPMKRYSFTVVEVQDQKIHIQMEGTAIVDGYANPCQFADFSGDIWFDYEPFSPYSGQD